MLANLIARERAADFELLSCAALDDAAGLTAAANAADDDVPLIIDDLHDIGADPNLSSTLHAILDARGSAAESTIVCSRERGVLDPTMLAVIEAGGAAVLGPDDLRLRPDECGDLFTQTGGWPLAVALARTTSDADPKLRLAEVAATALPERVTAPVTTLSRVPELPLNALADIVTTAQREDFKAWTYGFGPLVAETRSGQLVFSEAFRSCLAELSADATIAEHSARVLAESGHPEIAVELALGCGRNEQAAHILLDHRETFVRELNNFDQIAGWVERIPGHLVTPQIEGLHARARANLGTIDSEELAELADRLIETDPESGLWVLTLYGTSLIGAGDSRAAAVTVGALGRACGGMIETARLRDWLDTLPRTAIRPAFSLIQLVSIALLFTEDAKARSQAHELVQIAEDAAIRAGESTEANRAIFSIADVLVGGTSVREAWTKTGDALYVLDELAPTIPVRVYVTWGLGFVAIFAGDREGARHAANQLTELFEAHPSLGSALGERYRRDARLLSLLIEISELGDDADLQRQQHLDDAALDLWHGQLGREARWATFTALCMARSFFEIGDYARCSAWIGRGDERVAPVKAIAHDIEGLRLLCDIANERENDQAVETIHELAVERRDRGQHAAADELEVRLAVVMARTRGPTGDAGRSDALNAATGTDDGTDRDEVLHIRFFGPEIEIGPAENPRTLRGFSAKLLALLVSRDGRLTLDVAVDFLWRDIDLDSGRKRLHTTLYRLRNELGCDTATLRVEDDLVLLRAGGDLNIDVAMFKQLTSSDTASCERLAEALGLYRDDFCSTQFAYEDFAVEFRRVLRNDFSRAVSKVMRSALDGSATLEIAEAALGEIARTAARVIPEDAAVVGLAARYLSVSGFMREASEVVGRSAQKLRDLGLPTDELADASGLPVD